MTNEDLIKKICNACFMDVEAYEGIGKEAAKAILDSHPDFEITLFEKLSLELDGAIANEEFYPKGTEASARISLMVVSENLRIKPKLAHQDEIEKIMNKYDFKWQWA